MQSPSTLWPHSKTNPLQLTNDYPNQNRSSSNRRSQYRQDGPRQRQELGASEPAPLPECLQGPHPSLADWPPQPLDDCSLRRPPLGIPRRFPLRWWSQGRRLQHLVRPQLRDRLLEAPRPRNTIERTQSDSTNSHTAQLSPVTHVQYIFLLYHTCISNELQRDLDSHMLFLQYIKKGG